MLKQALILISVAISANFNIVKAAAPDKQIISRTTGEGTLVFIKPQKMSPLKGSKINKPITYDITLNSNIDSATITYTFHHSNPAAVIDSTTINNSSSFANELIYAEPEAKGWIYRLRFKIPIVEFKQTFCAPTQLSLTVSNQQFANPAKKQQQNSKICQTAIMIAELNKK